MGALRTRTGGMERAVRLPPRWVWLATALVLAIVVLVAEQASDRLAERHYCVQEVGPPPYDEAQQAAIERC